MKAGCVWEWWKRLSGKKRWRGRVGQTRGWRGHIETKTGMRREKIYARAHPRSCLTLSRLKGNIGPTDTALFLGTINLRQYRENRESLSCTVVSETGIQKLLSQTLAYIWLKKYGLRNIQRRHTGIRAIYQLHKVYMAYIMHMWEGIFCVSVCLYLHQAITLKSYCLIWMADLISSLPI